MSKFCPLPWMHLASHPAGYVTLCCEADHTGLKSASYDITDPTIFDGQPAFYNLKYHKLDRVMNSDSYRAVRKKMLSDEIPTPCQGCFDKEEKGLESKRVREMRNYPHYTEEHARSITAQDGTITTQLEFVELRLGNICNARCVTCNPLSSSQWRQDYLKLANKFEFMRDRYQMMDKDRFVTWPTGYVNANVFELDWPESQQFWDELITASKNLKVIYINGGEPTLIKKHWEYLERLISLGIAKNVELHYSLNMTNMPDKAFIIWGQFKKVRISCSIDDFNERNYYIRYPSEWHTVVKNLNKLKEHNNVEVSVAQTISVFNYDNLDVFWEFMNSLKVYVYYNFLHDPSYYSPKVIPVKYRKMLHNRYAERLPPYLFNQCLALFGNDEHDIEGMQRFKEVTQELDNIRGTEFKQVFPVLAAVMR